MRNTLQGQSRQKLTNSQRRSLQSMVKRQALFAVKKPKTTDVRPSRPNFSTIKQKASALEATIATGREHEVGHINDYDLAAPHRAPFAFLRDQIMRRGPKTNVSALIDKMTDASKFCEDAFKAAAEKAEKANGKKGYSNELKELAEMYRQTREDLQSALIDYLAPTLNSVTPNRSKVNLLRAVNNLASNAAGLGPHTTTNVPVGARGHLNATGQTAEPATPRGEAISSLVPTVAAINRNGQQKAVSISGDEHPVNMPGVNFENVNNQQRIYRAALWVARDGNVYRPRDHEKKLVGNLIDDWEDITTAKKPTYRVLPNGKILPSINTNGLKSLHMPNP